MPWIPNPCVPGGRKPIDEISDRAKRYRANACPPPGPRICHYCGRPDRVEVEHIDGDESNGSAKNLTWSCRSCNTQKAFAFLAAGKGTRTRQFNPEGGARSLAQWLTAVMSLKGQGEMSIRDAVALVHATPQSRRSSFAKEIWGLRRQRGTDRR